MSPNALERHETEFICFKQDSAISSINGKSLKFADEFTHLGSNILSTESDVNICLEKGMNC